MGRLRGLPRAGGLALAWGLLLLGCVAMTPRPDGPPPEAEGEGTTLAAYALEDGSPAIVDAVPVPSGDAQDVVPDLDDAEQARYVQALSDGTLDRIAHTRGDLPELVRLYYALVSGHLADEEKLRQAARILRAVAHRRPVESFAEEVMSPLTKVFPYRAGGFTVYGVPIDASPLPDGRIKVHLTSRTFGSEFRDEAHTLPGMDMVLDPDVWVGVTFHDDDGRVEYAPALFLLRVSGEGGRHLERKLLEATLLGGTMGLSLEAEALVELGTTPRLLPRMLAWCDRTSVVLGLAASALDEHRGWILSRFGEEGRHFLHSVDILNNAVALYGVARVVMTAPGLVLAVRGSYRNFLQRARLVEELTQEETRRLQFVRGSAENVLGQVDAASASSPSRGAQVLSLDDARRAREASGAATQSLPAVEEEALAPTGTDGRPVPVGQPDATARDGVTVASRQQGRGNGSTPLTSAPPSSRTQAPPDALSASRPPPGPAERPAGTQVAEREAPTLELLPGGLETGELTPEQLVDFKLGELEQEAEAGERLVGNTAQLRGLRPASPPPGVPAEDTIWQKYLAYFDKRLAELKANDEGLLKTRRDNPLKWDEYEALHRETLRGIELEKRVQEILQAEQELPEAEREFTVGILDPRVDWNLGLRKGARNTKYVDGFITGRSAAGPAAKPPRVSISCKSRNFKNMAPKPTEKAVWQDYQELVNKYGGTAEVRRLGHPLFGQEVEITRLHLVYDAKYMTDETRELILNMLRNRPVKVHFK